VTQSRLWLGLAALVALLFVAACGPSTVQPTTDQAASTAGQQAIEAAVQATLTAVAPTLTPTPSVSATSSVAATIASPADVPRITAQELRAKLDASQAVVFDARRKESYMRQHIAEALSLPWNEVAARLAELPTDRQAVFYCT
jgi:hypothetical protein